MRRILVIRPGGMGDMILLLPTLRAIKEQFPQTDIDLVCEKRNVEVLKLAGLEQSALVFDAGPARFLRELQSRDYDVAIDTEQFHHFSAVFALLSGAPIRIGFKINPRRNPLYTHLVNYAPDGSETEQFLRLLGPLGFTPCARGLEGLLSDAETPIGTGLENKMAQTFGSRPFVVVHTGASTRYKQWAPERFAELLRQLDAQHGMGAVLIGGNGDRPIGAKVAESVREAGGTVLSLTGQLDLQRVAGVIRIARLFVGADSGLSHLATAVDTPTVVLFGPSDHQKWGFENGHHAVVRKNLACAPCFIFGYHKPCRHIACMRQIGVPDVMEACTRVLKETPSPAPTPR